MKTPLRRDAAIGPEPHWNPYWSGIGLGLVLLLSFVVLGTGLGASGGLARAAATVCDGIAPGCFEDHPYAASWFDGSSPLLHYLVSMGAGVLFGGLLSAWIAGRMRVRVERGPRIGRNGRLLLALCGGVLVGFASRMAGGCTSGQALSGGALLLPGSWAFTAAVFAGGFAVAPFFRKEWEA